MAYEGKVVRFDCYVPPEYAGTEVMGMYCENDIYYPNMVVEMYMKNGESIKSDLYTVTGIYEESVSYYNEALGAEAIRPRIKIVEIN
jgi:hypothetical protein